MATSPRAEFLFPELQTYYYDQNDNHVKKAATAITQKSSFTVYIREILNSARLCLKLEKSKYFRDELGLQQYLNLFYIYMYNIYKKIQEAVLPPAFINLNKCYYTR
ncbi:MAG: hypothetical protein K2N99_02250, partial [Malacoplasma sp.]|nr:hypothetical protein [Malacoplasma sp.]